MKQDIVTESDQFRCAIFYSSSRLESLIVQKANTVTRIFHLLLFCNSLLYVVFSPSIEEFIPLLRERMNVLNPYVRQFLVGWITVLDSVPDIDMLGFLPDFLDGN